MHLFFLDDYFLFCKTVKKEADTLHSILGVSEATSRLSINFQKLEIFFSINTSHQLKQHIATRLGVSGCLGTRKYLGMPSMIGRRKKSIFGTSRDKVWKKIHNWIGKHLSKASRDILINVIAHAIPSYCMSVFFLPSSLRDEMQTMMNSFWWESNKATSNRINWINQDRLAMRKEHGVWGFAIFLLLI